MSWTLMPTILLIFQVPSSGTAVSVQQFNSERHRKARPMPLVIVAAVTVTLPGPCPSCAIA